MPTMLTVPRGSEFNHAEFFLPVTKIVREDDRSAVLTQIDLDRIEFVSRCRYDQRTTNLDAWMFKAMWTSKAHLPISLYAPLQQKLSFFQFYFGGTIFENEYGREGVLYLRWGLNHWFGPPGWRWHWGFTPFAYQWGYPFPFAVLRP